MESITFLVAGITFGAAAGLSPGPLLTLLISQTVRHNRKEGLIVAGVPLLTDLPIILISLLALSKLPNSHFILGTISVLGALFIGYLAYESLTIRGLGSLWREEKAHSLRKGILINILNPHAYLFWITIGSPIILKAYRLNLVSAIFFIFGFYLFLIGSKIMVALLVDKSRIFFRSRGYVYLTRLMGLILLVFAILFVKEGLQFYGVI